MMTFQSVNSSIQPNVQSKPLNAPPPQFILPEKNRSGVAPSVGAYIGASTIVSLKSALTMGIVLPAMKNNGKKLSEEEIDKIHNMADKTLQESGLKEKGVKIRYLGKIEPKISDSIDSSGKFLKTILDTMLINPVREGNNAFFVSKDIAFKDNGVRKVYLKKNSIVAPKKDIAGCVFHEIGHAMNRHFSMFGKCLQNLRGFSLACPGIIMLYGACTRKSKPKDGEELNNKQKTKNFIRNNAGLLAFAATTPVLIEEGMATYKGQKFANKFLSKDLAANVAKGNKIAYCSYALLGLFSAIGAFAAVKIKDKMIKD